MRSLVTLAMIDAAAMENTLVSPLTIVSTCAAFMFGGVRFPSIKTAVGVEDAGSFCTAASIARYVACRMLIWSMSCASWIPLQPYRALSWVGVLENVGWQWLQERT
jgi:hypothetical protein